MSGEEIRKKVKKHQQLTNAPYQLTDVDFIGIYTNKVMVQFLIKMCCQRGVSLS